MDLYFSAAEHPSQLRTLLDLGVKHVAISYYEWQRRHATDELRHHIPADVQVLVTAGVSKKEAIDWEDFGDSYIEFAARHSETCIIYDMDAPSAPKDVRKHVRDQLSLLPNVVAFPFEDEDLSSLALTHERIGINSPLAKSIPANELRRLQATLYGSNVTDPRTLKISRMAATSTMAWLSARRYGELRIFARGKLHRYKAENVVRAVRIHEPDIRAYGVDPALCAANDHAALTQVTVLSLVAMAEHLSRRPRDRQKAAISEQEGSLNISGATGAHGDIQVHETGVLPVEVRQRRVLPVISMKTQGDRQIVESVAESLMVCDSCYLSSVCPEYKAQNSCAFEIPFHIQSDQDWEKASQTLLDMQFQRIQFGYFAEQIEGQGTNPRLGQEMDRFNKMLKDIKELKAPTFGDGQGILSQVFGDNPGAAPPEAIIDPQALAIGNPFDDTEEEDDTEEAEVIYDYGYPEPAGEPDPGAPYEEEGDSAA